MNHDLTAAVHTYLTTAPTSQFLGQPVDVLDHWTGDENLLWHVDMPSAEAVVKVFLDAGQVRSRRQFDAQTDFAPFGLAPVPLWLDHFPEGLAPYALVVYRWVDGSPLSDAPSAPDELAGALAQVHTTDPSGQRRFSPHPINFDFYWRIAQNSLAQVEAWLNAAQYSDLHQAYTTLRAAATQLAGGALPLWQQAMPTPVHGDVQLANVVAAPGALHLVDWEMSGLGDPAYEVASFLQRSQAVLSPNQTDTWLEAYLDRADLPGLDLRIAVYRRLLPLHAVTYLLNGLREHTGEEHRAELQEALPFLLQTLAASLDYAVQQLGVDLGKSGQDLADELASRIGPNA